VAHPSVLVETDILSVVRCVVLNVTRAESSWVCVVVVVVRTQGGDVRAPPVLEPAMQVLRK
jgi:hypothetical protein